MVLIQGTAIVNESMLTGESVPIIKNPINPFSDDVYDPNDSSSGKMTIFSGTKVIQARQLGGQPVLALVSRTNYLTIKGALVRDILYPKATQF